MDTLAITICATASYQYALESQARLIQANLIAWAGSAHLVLVTDEKPLTGILESYRALFGESVSVHHVRLPVTDGHTNYKEDAQLAIAQMRTAAFCTARTLGADFVWSLDSDVLPPGNALKCMVEILAFDDGYYGVATCPYPSQGGGGFLFGRGTPQKQIADDVTEDERTLPPGLMQELEEHRAKQPKDKPDKAWIKEMQRLEEEVKKCPPKGNVFELNGKGWKKRGWGEMAYPAIGKGSIVPTDWVGMGNTLIGAKALQLADFAGYDGKGTEDLFLVWRCWYPNGIRCAALPHCLSHHVIRNKDKGGYTLCYAYHETEGETAGHIRLRHLPWYSHEPGERAITPG